MTLRKFKILIAILFLIPVFVFSQDVDLDTPIGKKWVQLGANSASGIGSPITWPLTTTIGGEYQQFEGGTIFYSSLAGAVYLSNEIFDYWLSTENHQDISGNVMMYTLSYPIQDMEYCAEIDSDIAVFEGGGIINPSTGNPMVIYGGIWVYYLTTLKKSPGVPLGYEAKMTGTNNSVQTFSNGVIHKTPKGVAYMPYGPIYDCWWNSGNTLGDLGMLILDQAPVIQDGVIIGEMAGFEKGNVYWSSATGAHTVLGRIRAKYINNGGPASWLGFPTGDSITRSSGIQYNDFQSGLIVYDTTNPTFDPWIFNELMYHITYAEAHNQDGEGGICNPPDLYFRIDITTNTGIVYDSPWYGCFPGKTDADLKYYFGKASSSLVVNLTAEGKDADDWGTGGDEHIGTIVKTYTIDNMWGLLDDVTIRENDFSINAKMKDINIPYDSSDFYGNMWWDFGNFSTSQLSHSQFAATFADVYDGEPWYLNPLNEAFYWVFYEDKAENGNCFGISLESIYARYGKSVYSQPIHRFWPDTIINDSGSEQLDSSLSHHASTMNVMNIKQGYQLGGEAVLYFMAYWALMYRNNIGFEVLSSFDIFNFMEMNGLYSQGPVAAFYYSYLLNLDGNYPIIGLQHANLGISGHVVVPYEWKVDGTDLIIYVADPDYDQVLPPPDEIDKEDYKIVIDSLTNTFSYEPTGVEFGGSVSEGGLILVYPSSIFMHQPHTPMDLPFELIEGALSVTFGGTGRAKQITDSSGRTFYDSSLYTGTPTKWEHINQNSLPAFARVPNFGGLAGEMYIGKVSLNTLKWDTVLKSSIKEKTAYVWTYNSPYMSVETVIPGLHDIADELTLENMTSSTMTAFQIANPSNGITKEVRYTMSSIKKDRWIKFDDVEMIPGQSIKTKLSNGGMNVVMINDGPATTADVTVKYGDEFDAVHVGIIDIESGENEVFKFDAPKSDIVICGYTDDNGWFMNYPQIWFTAIDYTGTGIDYIEYSYDNITWYEFTGMITYDKVGVSTLYYRAKDNAGNLEETRSMEFKVDLRPFIFRFDDDILWTANYADITYDSVKTTDGNGSWSITGEGWMELISPFFLTSDISNVSSRIAVDIFIPDPASNPYYIGDVTLVYHNPRLGINSFNIGTVNLNDMTLGEWNTLYFDLPENVVNALLDYSSASRFQLNINMPLDGKSFNIDNMRFVDTGTGLVENPNFDIYYDVYPYASLWSFEELADWSSTAELSLSADLKTSGDSSLKVNAPGYTVVESREFYSKEIIIIGEKLYLDVYIPDTGNQYWNGDIQMFLTCRGQDKHNIYNGIFLLDDIALNSFNTVSFDLDSEALDLLTNGSNICELSIVINGNPSSEYRLDNIRFDD